MDVIKTEIHKPNKKLSMTFEGLVTFDLIDSITMAISKRLDEIEPDINIRKKVFGVLMECLQNLGSHVEREPQLAPSASKYNPAAVLFVIDSTDAGYRIMTTNYLSNDKVKTLEKWLQEIKSLNLVDLKKKYNSILVGSAFSRKGGGGLGFLDITLRVAGNIDYKFEKVNSDFSLFTFQATIKKN